MRTKTRSKTSAFKSGTRTNEWYDVFLQAKPTWMSATTLAYAAFNGIEYEALPEDVRGLLTSITIVLRKSKNSREISQLTRVKTEGSSMKKKRLLAAALNFVEHVKPSHMDELKTVFDVHVMMLLQDLLQRSLELQYVIPKNVSITTPVEVRKDAFLR
jgi:hypothetical protein